MNKKPSLVLILLVVIAGLTITPKIPVLAHAAPIGQVCISNSNFSNPNNCPPAPFTFTGAVNTPLDVRVNYQGAPTAATFNTFDISVAVPSTGLDIPNVATTCAIVSNCVTIDPVFSVPAQICIDGIVVTGTCSPSDGPGIVHVVAASFSFTNANQTLMTIHYTVLSSSTSTTIGYLNDPSCSASSDPNFCVSLIGLTSTSVQENIEAGDFTNVAPTANFAASPVRGLGPLTVQFDASLSTAQSPANIIRYNWDFGDASPAANVTTTTTSHNYVTAGIYHPILYVLDSNNLKSEHKDGLQITVLNPNPDFAISANPSTLTILQGQSQNSTINLASINKFNGTLTLTATTTQNTITVKLNRTSVHLTSTGRTNSSILTVSPSLSTPIGNYNVIVTATNQTGAITHQVIVPVTVVIPDFTINASPQSVTVPQGVTGQTSINLASLHTFNGTVTLNATSASPTSIQGVTVPGKITLDTITRPSASATLAIAVQLGTFAGPHNITLTGTSGLLIHKVNVTVIVPQTDFGVQASPTSVSLQAGASANSTIILTGINGFAGTLTISANSLTTFGISTTATPAGVAIAPTSSLGTSTLDISTTSTTPAGTYTIQIAVTNGTLIHNNAIIALTVTLPLASIRLGGLSLSTTTATLGKLVNMTIIVTNTQSATVNITIHMNVYSGIGSPLTVASKTILLTTSQPTQTIVLSWDTSSYSAGTYQVNATITGQPTSVNQAASAGTVTLNTAPTNAITLSDLVPWLAIAEAALIVVLAILVLRGRKPPAAV